MVEFNNDETHKVGDFVVFKPDGLLYDGLVVQITAIDGPLATTEDPYKEDRVVSLSRLRPATEAEIRSWQEQHEKYTRHWGKLRWW